MSLVCLAVVVAVIGYFTAVEVGAYLTRSEEKARIAANGLFLQICEQLHLDPSTFYGPERMQNALESDEKSGSYTFVWARRKEETIAINVSYLPMDMPYSISPAITFPRGVPAVLK